MYFNYYSIYLWLYDLFYTILYQLKRIYFEQLHDAYKF